MPYSVSPTLAPCTSLSPESWCVLVPNTRKIHSSHNSHFRFSPFPAQQDYTIYQFNIQQNVQTSRYLWLFTTQNVCILLFSPTITVSLSPYKHWGILSFLFPNKQFTLQIIYYKIFSSYYTSESLLSWICFYKKIPFRLNHYTLLWIHTRMLHYQF